MAYNITAQETPISTCFLEKEKFQIAKHSDTQCFNHYDEYYNAILENSKLTGAADSEGIAFHCEAPFASVKSETHRLFGMIDMTVFEILPMKNIDIHYELDWNFFHLSCVTVGSLHLLIDRRSGDLTRLNGLYMSPPSGSQGRMIYFKDRPVKSISFYVSRTDSEAMNAVLGEHGRELWEMAGWNKHGRGILYPATNPPPDVVNSFLQIANCNYPHRVRRLFFENALREILVRLIAHELPNEESFISMDEFEIERIKSIPGILMERLDAPPSVLELARDLSISATRLARGFKEIFGKPIYSYHRDMCLERAAIMLRNTSKSILDIALDAGYSNGGNFCYAFKKHYGVSPRQYRKNGKLPCEEPSL
jgi:AraC-like DNA-binding protein